MRRIRPGAWLVAIMGLFVAGMTALAYTTGQAEAGQQVFGSTCAGCHGADLLGGVGPALIGPGFRAVWRDAGALFTFVAQNMPLGRPGALSKEEYWRIVAYLLQRNGVAPDEVPLSEETARGIRLQEPTAG